MLRDPATRAFLIHLAAYVAVNAVMAAVNLMQTPAEGEPLELWFQWPLLGWGIGVVAHGLGLVLRKRGRGRLADPDVQGFAIHLFVYVAVNALLVGVDLTTSPGAQWFYWPLLGWGVGVAAHGLILWRSRRRGALAGGPLPEPPARPGSDGARPSGR